MLIIDQRRHLIIQWLEHTVGLEIIRFEVASSDASFRRYFRVTHQQGQHIVMDAPPEQETTEPFIRIAGLLAAQGLTVPVIVQQHCAQGFLLLEDFGSHCFLDRLTNDNASTLYASALDSLYLLQSRIDPTRCQLPHYHETLLSQELALFYDWFLQRSLKLSIPDRLQVAFDHTLISSAIEQPQVCVHRDFHSRNLMVLAANSPGIIDFQDAVIGPITYDLVSLLRDCYIDWDETKVSHWMSGYFQRISGAGQIKVSLETFTRWFDLMGLQRHLKAIGIFSRLHLRDQKPNYLDDIPRTLNYVVYICQKYAELAEFNHYLSHSILPAYHASTGNPQ